MATPDLGKMVPGFDFLQGLMKTAGSTLPSFGQWVAPTLDPAELDKRIQELRTVQFWLEQNARMIASTVQALEVQRMTLKTLQGMNVSMGELTEAFKITVPDVAKAPAAEAASAPAPAPAPAPAAAPEPPPAARPRAARKPAAAPAAPLPGGIVDPMQWWGALTQQFSEIAAQAAKSGGVEAATGLAGELGRQAAEAAGKAFQAVTPGAAAPAAKTAAAKPAAASRTAKRRATPAAPTRAASRRKG